MAARPTPRPRPRVRQPRQRQAEQTKQGAGHHQQNVPCPLGGGVDFFATSEPV